MLRSAIAFQLPYVTVPDVSATGYSEVTLETYADVGDASLVLERGDMAEPVPLTTGERDAVRTLDGVGSANADPRCRLMEFSAPQHEPRRSS